VNDDSKGRFTVNNNEKKPDREWVQRPAVAFAEAAISSASTNLALFFNVPKSKRS
jgi:hypothetical protein